MADQKIENLLELSLDVDEQTREKSENLQVGYDTQDAKWEIILRYSGEMGNLAERYGKWVDLLGGFAIAEVTKEQLLQLSEEPLVEFIEKPKALSFAVYEGKLVSCIPPIQRPPYSLTGQGILVGIVDSGIDIFHPDFRREDGSTRIVGLWDQTLTPEEGSEQAPPEGYQSGVYFSEEDINAILQNESRSPTQDRSGHGTHVAGIAVGNGRASRGENRGVAYEADILVVKLGSPTAEGFPQTAQLMQGIDFCVRMSIRRNEPLALNLSYGNNYGSHTGTSLIETYLDTVANMGRTTICVGSGNEGNLARHAEVELMMGMNSLIEFVVAPGEFNLAIQIWKQYTDSFQIRLTSPSGDEIILGEDLQGMYRYVIDGTELLWYFGDPAPYSIVQEIYFELLPEGVSSNIRSGVWKIVFIPKMVVDGQIDLWMPSGSSINRETGFLISDADRTLTIPSTASRPITVGAYNGDTDSYAPFSGRGYVCCGWVKPDLVAPGVDILSCSPGGGYVSRTGTSMACPFVTGSAALLMQYGIVEGRDPYLFGQKVKAFLIRGARQLPAFEEYPNDSVGWGALCVRDSLPG